MTYLIEYLGEFEFILETILDYESGDQMGSFDAKKPPSKISCLGTFKFKYSLPDEKLQFLQILMLQLPRNEYNVPGTYNTSAHLMALFL